MAESEPDVERVLVSACLLGQAVRWDGGHRASDHPTLARWRTERRVVAVCPELAGALPVPRPAAEIEHGAGGAAVLAGRSRVIDATGADHTAAFVRGAEAALAAVRAHGIRVAVLKEDSPSCGSRQTYDGRFEGRRVALLGVTTALLRSAGVQVFSEHELEAADAALRR